MTLLLNLGGIPLWSEDILTLKEALCFAEDLLNATPQRDVLLYKLGDDFCVWGQVRIPTAMEKGVHTKHIPPRTLKMR